jgi:hypothetical protein
MTTQILTILIAAAVLAGSAATALQALAPVSARTESATSGGAQIFAVVPPAGRFAASAGSFTHGARWIVVLTPRPLRR